MSIKIGPPAIEELRPRIAVIGVGGAGGNAIANMIRAEIEGVQFVVANTDAQSLNISVAEHRIQLGPDITQGLGAGSRPEVGRAAAEETLGEIERVLDGAHMVFIAAGMGGGTGTGAAPVIAKAARDKGVLTVGVVTKPFLFEGTRRMRAAEAGIEELQKNVDTLIVIPNQNLFLVAKADTTFKEAFHLADEVLQQGVRSITDLMVMPGLINLDFADVRSVMAEMGKAMMGTGEGSGENRALEAAEKAIANPLLDGVSMQGAKGVIISIIGGDDMKLLEVDEAANHIRNLVDPQANIIWGSAFNPDLQGRIRVSVVATGIEQIENHSGEHHSRAFALQAARGPARPEPKPEAQPVPAMSTTPPAPPIESGARPFDPPAAAPEAPAAEPTAPAMSTKPPFSAPADAPFELGAANEIEPAAPVKSHLGKAGEASPRAQAETGASHERTAEYAGTQAKPESDGPVLRAKPPLDFSAPAPAAQSEPMLDATRLSGNDEPAAPAAGRRRSMIPQDEPGIAPPSPDGPAAPSAGGAPAPSPASASGGTLFERMANFTARRKPADGEDEEDEAGAISIPRFLGRQNNQ